MDTETVVMSEKGQIVVPLRIRKKMGAAKGTLFAIAGSRDAAIIRKVHSPTREELLQEMKVLAREIAKDLKAKGLSEEDVIQLALKGRGGRN